MNNKTKIILLSFALSLVIFVIIWGIMGFLFPNLENPYKSMISAGIMFILSPKLKILRSQSGLKLQMTWIFIKKTITV